MAYPYTNEVATSGRAYYRGGEVYIMPIAGWGYVATRRPEDGAKVGEDVLARSHDLGALKQRVAELGRNHPITHDMILAWGYGLGYFDRTGHSGPQVEAIEVVAAEYIPPRHPRLEQHAGIDERGYLDPDRTRLLGRPPMPGSEAARRQASR